MSHQSICPQITRTRRVQDYGTCGELKIRCVPGSCDGAVWLTQKFSVVARNNDILKRLVLEAKKEYEKDAVHRVHIFMADTCVSTVVPPLMSSHGGSRTYCCWRWNGARQKRPMSSIVLEPGVKDMILADCKDFLQSEDWYVSVLRSISKRAHNAIPLGTLSEVRNCCRI